MAVERLHTIRSAGSCDLVIRRSRFLGIAEHCGEHAEAEALLRRIRAEHSKATHHVSAWRLKAPRGGAGEHRFDDDGEPGGTAGRPVLQVLEGRSLVNAAVVVVRYFGGIKLGAGGLVRAYGEAAAKALDDAVIEEIIPQVVLRADFSYPHLASVENWIARHAVTIRERRFVPEPQLMIQLPAADEDALREALTNLTNGSIRIEVVRGGE